MRHGTIVYIRYLICGKRKKSDLEGCMENVEKVWWRWDKKRHGDGEQILFALYTGEIDRGERGENDKFESLILKLNLHGAIFLQEFLEWVETIMNV